MQIIKEITFNYNDVVGLPHGTVIDNQTGMDFNQFIDANIKLKYAVY